MTGGGWRRAGVGCAAGGLLLLSLLTFTPRLVMGTNPACPSCDARHQRLADQRATVAGAGSGPILPESQKALSE